MFILTQTKRCTKCGEQKDRSFFAKDKSRKDGLQPWCTECYRAYRERNSQNERERCKRYREENKDKVAEMKRNYNANNSEKISEKNRRYYKENREKLVEQARQYRKDNPGVWREWFFKNIERLTKQSKKWRKNNPQKVAVYNRNISAQRRKAEGKITLKEWENLKVAYDHTCLCCMRREPEISLTLDHVIPLKLGGKNVIENAQPLCQSCNSRKRDRYIDYRNSEVKPPQWMG